MKLFFRFILVLVCLATGTVSNASQEEDLKTLRQRISDLQQDFDKTNESKSAAVEALKESERNVSNSNRKLNELSQAQIAASHSILQLKQQSSQLQYNARHEQIMLSQLLYQQYLDGKQEYIKLLLNNHDPNQVAREFQYYDYIVRSRALWIKSLREKIFNIKVVADKIQQKSSEISSLQNEEHMQKQHLLSETRLRQQVLDKYSAQLKHQKQEIGRLQLDETRLSQLIDKLSKIISYPIVSKNATSSRLPDTSFDGKPFALLKGKLALPVKGIVSNKFGSPRPDSHVLWKGYFVRATTNQSVMTVAAGRVVFADWLRGFGNLLIVDHGNGYMSLYGNNEALLKQVGDVLHGGDVIAYVGNSGGNEESGLYFELRHEGNPLDPGKWIAR